MDAPYVTAFVVFRDRLFPTRWDAPTGGPEYLTSSLSIPCALGCTVGDPPGSEREKSLPSAWGCTAADRRDVAIREVSPTARGDAPLLRLQALAQDPPLSCVPGCTGHLRDRLAHTPRLSAARRGCTEPSRRARMHRRHLATDVLGRSLSLPHARMHQVSNMWIDCVLVSGLSPRARGCTEGLYRAAVRRRPLYPSRGDAPTPRPCRGTDARASPIRVGMHRARRTSPCSVGSLSLILGMHRGVSTPRGRRVSPLHAWDEPQAVVNLKTA